MTPSLVGCVCGQSVARAALQFCASPDSRRAPCARAVACQVQLPHGVPPTFLGTAIKCGARPLPYQSP